MEKLSKRNIQDLIDAISRQQLTDWTKYKKDGNVSGDRICQDEAKKRRSDLLNKLYLMKGLAVQEEIEFDMQAIVNKGEEFVNPDQQNLADDVKECMNQIVKHGDTCKDLEHYDKSGEWVVNLCDKLKDKPMVKWSSGDYHKVFQIENEWNVRTSLKYWTLKSEQRNSRNMTNADILIQKQVWLLHDALTKFNEIYKVY